MSHWFRKLPQVPLCTFHSKTSSLVPYLYFCPVVWYLGLFGLTLHGTLSLAAYFSLTLNVVPPKTLGCTLCIPWANVSNLCTRPRTPEPDLSLQARTTELFCFHSVGPLFPSMGPGANLTGPLNTCSPSFGGVALGFNLCYPGNPKVKTSSIAQQNIQTIFPRFANRNF